jgi:hypothetical protein
MLLLIRGGHYNDKNPLIKIYICYKIHIHIVMDGDYAFYLTTT